MINRKFKSVYVFVAEEINSQSIRDTLNYKSGIYIWENTVNGKIYVGSAINLWERFLDYNQPVYCKNNSNSLIIKAFKKIWL